MARAEALARHPDYVRIQRLISRALELKDELDASDLERLLPSRLLERYLTPDEGELR